MANLHSPYVVMSMHDDALASRCVRQIEAVEEMTQSAIRSGAERPFVEGDSP
jgi:hypothetical protein